MEYVTGEVEEDNSVHVKGKKEQDSGPQTLRYWKGKMQTGQSRQDRGKRRGVWGIMQPKTFPSTGRDSKLAPFWAKVSCLRLKWNICDMQGGRNRTGGGGSVRDGTATDWSWAPHTHTDHTSLLSALWGLAYLIFVTHATHGVSVKTLKWEDFFPYWTQKGTLCNLHTVCYFTHSV